MLERIKMTETFKSLEALLLVECVPNVTNAADSLADWYKYGNQIFLFLGLLRFLIIFYFLKEWLKLSFSNRKY